MSMLRRALQMISTPAVDVVPSKVPNERKQLREALEAHAQAMQVQREADASVDRVRDFVRTAEDADGEALAAEEAASAATKAWAERGARDGTSPANHSLLDRAEAASRFAADARSMAHGARQGLPKLTEVATDARIAVSQAKDSIQSAVAAVLLAEAAPQLAIIEESAARYNEALAEVKSLQFILRRWGDGHQFHRFSSPDIAAVIARHIKDNAIGVPEDRELYQGARSWVDFAQRLAADPDATL